MTASEPDDISSQNQVLEALVTAAIGQGLYLQNLPDLTGAVVAGATVDAYVIAVRDGFNVELWRAEDADPFQIEHFDDLSRAAASAVAAAASHDIASARPHLLEAL